MNADWPSPDDDVPDNVLVVPLLEMANRLSASDDVGETFESVTATAVEVIPACDMASISLIEGKRVVTRAPTAALAEEVDFVQYRTNQGPCLAAAYANRFVYSPDVGNDHRWPKFSLAVAAEYPALSIASCRFPLASEGTEAFGSINMYGEGVHAFSESDLLLALLLASQAGTVVDAARRRLQYREAMRSRDIIGQAKGILMAHNGLQADEAFDLLNRRSQHLNIRVRELAQRVIESCKSDLAQGGPSNAPTEPHAIDGR